MGKRVFISYAGEDRKRAQQVSDELERLGAEPWFAPRDVSVDGNFVRGIEQALDDAQLVLVLWSRAAAGSAWVQAERDSALALKLGGAPLSVTMARLDDTSLPPLSVAENALDLRPGQQLTAPLAACVGRLGAPPPDDDLPRRIRETEIGRDDAIQVIADHLEHGDHVVVFKPRKAGSLVLTRQLVRWMRQQHPDWHAAAVPAVNLGGETDREYSDRMRGLIWGDGGSKTVAFVHGWSSTDEPFQRVLGALLRAEAEVDILHRPLQVVALGGYPVYLQRYAGGDWSLLNTAKPVFLDDLTHDQVARLLRDIGGGWSDDDVGQVCRRAGGHPHLVKQLLLAWAADPAAGWSAAEDALVDDEELLVPAVARLHDDQPAKQALRRLLAADDGLRWPAVNPTSPLIRLYFDALLRREGRRVYLRCSAVRTLVEELLE